MYFVFVTCPYCRQRVVATNVRPYDEITDTKLCANAACQKAFLLRFSTISGAAEAMPYSSS